MKTAAPTLHISFDSKVEKIGNATILRFPKTASAKLPSRGLGNVRGTINGHEFRAVLEPDGMFSHFMYLDAELLDGAEAAVGDTVSLSVEPSKEWPEPAVPADIKRGIASVPAAQTTWDSVTPMARWEWIRWIRATNRDETRQKRIAVAASKLQSGMRRPCCFNAAMCTDPAVSKGGVLLDPSK